MMQKLIPLLFLFLTAIFLTACQQAQPVLVADTLTYDLGDVVNGEVVSHHFFIRNEGSAPLIVETVITTCGCTTASLEPMTIQAGESGTVHVTFDSGAHGPNLRGAIVREIFITTNDPKQRETILEITANLIGKDG